MKILRELNYDDLRKQNFKELHYSISNSIMKIDDVRDRDLYVVAIAYVALVSKYVDLENMIEHITITVKDENIQNLLLTVFSKYQDAIESARKMADENELKALILFSDNRAADIPESTTPEYISDLALKLLDVSSEDTIMDLGSGLGEFLTRAATNTNCNNLYGVEINTRNFKFSSLRALVIEKEMNVIQGNMISQEFEYLHANKVFSNFPLGMKMSARDKEIGGHSKLKTFFKNSKRTITSDWIYVMAAYYSMSKSGKAVCIMANNGTWNQADQEIRKAMIEKGIIEAIIALPPNLFSYTNIAVTMIVLSNNNEQIKLIDASNVFTERRRQNILEANDVEKIFSAYNSNSDISRTIKIEELRENEYALNPTRYLEHESDIKDGIPLEDVIISVNRGAVIKSSDLDELVSSENTGYHYLMLQNITDGMIDTNLPNLKKIEDKYLKYCITNNSLIVSKISPFKVALAQFDEDEKVLANGNLYYISVDESKVNPVFLEAFLQSEVGIAQLTRLSKGAVMSSISIQDLKKVKIPKVSLAEQECIAEEYSSLKNQLIILEKQIDIVKDKKSRLLEEVV